MHFTPGVDVILNVHAKTGQRREERGESDE